jgi:diguanylate cyclase
VQKQGVIKKSVDEAKHALRLMTTTFVARLATLAADAGEHSERLDRYAMEIEHAEDIEELSDLVVQLAQDTRERQVDLTHVHDELVDTRRHAEEYEQRVERLERELAQLSDRLHEDQLTELLNRRGLDRQFDVELSRATRSGQPLSVCLIDIDDFKRINDTYGHQAGDRVLVHLSRLMRNSVRPADVVARYGGEEFVVLLPATHAAEAEVVMARVQRELTRHFFLHNNERVLVTFSAGVAEAAAGETAAVVLQRADEALYLAKERGKNRVMVRSAPAEGLAASDGTLDSEALARSAAE